MGYIVRSNYIGFGYELKMKRNNIMLLLMFLSILCLVACSFEKIASTTESLTSTFSTSNNAPLYNEIENLKTVNESLVDENNSLKNQIDQLNQTIEQLHLSPLSSNYRAVDLLRKCYDENSTVDIFYGKLQYIHIETIDKKTYFIFSIDKVDVNPNWNGPGSTEGGYFLNHKEEYVEYRGGLSTIFMDKGFINYLDKREKLLADYGHVGDYGYYIFYMVGNEIVATELSPP